jgi:formylglycine-generating enzyme required for sulfatase activity
MKKAMIFVISLLLVGMVSIVPCNVQAASMAVLVVGLEADAASDAFAAGIKYEFTQKGYTMVDNNVVAAKLQELRNKHAEGITVDTVGLAAWGKDNSIDFVQLVVERECNVAIGLATAKGREQVVQVVCCGTAKYTDREYYRTQLVSHEEMKLAEMGVIPVAGGVFELFTNYYVQLSDFHIGRYEVTHAQWKKVMGSLPSGLPDSLLGDNKPITCASWDSIAGSGGFLERLNQQTGRNYRLPTEAEWMYAARGCKEGSCDSYAYSGSDDIDEVAWYSENSGAMLHEVGEKLPNRLGFYDMSGNVLEFCSDKHNNIFSTNTPDAPAVNPTGPTTNYNTRVTRGGSWGSIDADNCSFATARYGTPSSVIWVYYGFRLVLP